MQPLVLLALTYACVVSADTSDSHKQMADSAMKDLIASVPEGRHEKFAADLRFVDALITDDNPHYRKYTEHARNYHREYLAEQATALAPRRAQEDEDPQVARLEELLSEQAAHQARGDALILNALNAAEENAAARAAVVGDAVGSGTGPFEHLRSVFSSSSCTDPYADNDGDLSSACRYSCETLQNRFTPAQGSWDRCFVYDAETGTWPDSASGSDGLDLLSLKKTSLDWFEFLEPTPALDGVPLEFQIGEGRVCRNITIQTLAGPGNHYEVEELCVLDGIHEHPHLDDDPGHFRIVGYTDNITHVPGETTEIVVGECTDVTIRVVTTSASPSPFSIVLNDYNHNGPFPPITVDGSVTAPEGEDVATRCMFQNNFTLELQGASSWAGTVQLLSVVDDNTVYVPPQENWLVHGGPSASGLPVLLDARIQMGLRGYDPVNTDTLSTGSIVLRYVRLTGQVGTLDRFIDTKVYSSRKIGDDPAPRIGGAFFYEGIGGRLIFDRLVCDHNLATSGACFMVDGRMDVDENLEGVEIQIKSSFFWENWATWVGGVLRGNDFSPFRLEVSDCVMIDNKASLGGDIGISTYNTIPETPQQGRGYWRESRIYCQYSNFVSIGRNLLAQFPGQLAEGSPRAGLDMTFENVTATGGTQFASQLVHFYDPETNTGATTHETENFRGVDIYDTEQGDLFAGLFFGGEALFVEHSRIENSRGEGINPTGGAFHVAANFGSRFEGVHFLDNVAGLGGALFLSGAAVGDEAIGILPGHQIINCLFSGNTAKSAGGAVAFQAGETQDLFILDSVFSSNSVGLPAGEPASMDVVFRVFTASTAVGSGASTDPARGPAVVPIWFVGPTDDTYKPNVWDGDIAEMKAAYTSEGTFFDGNLATNHTYQTQTTYSKVIRLPVGRYRLWHGSILNTADIYHVNWDAGGWIDAVGVLDKVFPSFCDSRAGSCGNTDWTEFYDMEDVPNPSTFTRDGDCYAGTDTGCAEVETDTLPNCCPRGQSVWSYTEFSVPYGQGGAITASTLGDITVRSASFSANEAGVGSTLNVIGAHLELTDSTFDNDADTNNVDVPAIDMIELTGVTQKTCDTDSCDPGFRCEWAGNAVRMCRHCSNNEYGDGQSCHQCPSGTQPNEDQSSCVTCEQGYVSVTGTCLQCGLGTTSSAAYDQCVTCSDNFVVDESSKLCGPCPDGQQADELGIVCVPCPVAYAGLNGECEMCPAGTISSDDRTQCTACPAGKSPNEDQTTCTDCRAGLFSASGISCQSCATVEPGLVPNAAQTECEPCAPGFQPSAMAAQCESCALMQNTYSDDGMQCRECPARQQPSLDYASCDCMPETYNQLNIGIVMCNGKGIGGNMYNDQCAACPDCLDCSVPGTTSLRPGWAFYGQNTAFSCLGNEDVATESCIGGELSNNTVSARAWERDGAGFSTETLESTCGLAYTGPLCANCRVNFHHLKVGKACTACDDGRVDIPMMLGLIFATVVAALIVLSGIYSMLVDHGIVTDLRLLLGFYQILGQMDNVLSISFPRPVPQLLEFVGFLFLDLRKFIKLDCWDVGGFYGKFVTNCAVVPALAVGCCILLYLNQRRTISVAIAAGGADQSALRTADVSFQQNIFFSVFLLYPLITATLFRVPQCRTLFFCILLHESSPLYHGRLYVTMLQQDLSEDSYHEDDFTVDCTSGSFTAAMSFALLLIFVIPIGVPLIFFFLMMRAKNALPEGRVNSTVLGGAKLCSDELDDDQDRYGFLCRDLKPQYWYYESVIYCRKLALGGLSIVVGRGTMAQAYFVASVEACFLMYHMRVYPYVREQHNQIEALGHMNDDEEAFVNESFPREGYGWFICAIYVFVLPLPTAVSFWRGVQRKSANLDEKYDIGELYDNPLTMVEDGTTKAGESNTVNESAAGAVTLARLAKLSREKKELQEQVDMLTKDTPTAPQQAPAAQESADAVAAPQPAQPREPDPPELVQRLKIKELAMDESLGEEVRADAQRKLDALVADQALQAKAIADKEHEAQISDVRLSALANKARFNQRLVATMKQKGQDGLAEWLATNRLLHHESTILKITGEQTAPEDFLLLSEESVSEITSGMTQVEGARFVAAVSKLTSDQSNSTV